MANPDAHAGPMVRRCAWCGRYAVAGRWRRGGSPPVDARTATHTICPTCARRLRREGLSA